MPTHYVNNIKIILKLYGKIDILTNIAGITRDATLVKMELADFKKVLDVNLTGVFICTQAVSLHMIANKSGEIISTSSVSGIYGNLGKMIYDATIKAALVGMI